MGADSALYVSASSNTGVAFSQILADDGVPMYPHMEDPEEDPILSGLPPFLRGGIFIRAASAPAANTAITLVAAGIDARVYVSVESGPKAQLVVDGQPATSEFIRALAATPGWRLEDAAPCLGNQEMSVTMFSAPMPRSTPLVFPRLPDGDAVMAIIVVPVFAGSFAVSLSSSTGISYDRMARMEEGVAAWYDRDHRYISVPEHMSGGILFQGPYKDIPEGTELSLRPNARARIFVLVERSRSGGLTQTLPACGWEAEAGAPRWHEMPTMLTFCRDCDAGCLVTTPPTRGTATVFSVVVVPAPAGAAAPVEVSCSTQAARGASVPRLDLVPFVEGAVMWHNAGDRLREVPQWMQGITLIRSVREGPRPGTVITVRTAAASVVYIIVESQCGDDPGRSGGLLPDVLPAAGWELREQAPRCLENSTMQVYARRVAPGELLSLPLISEAGGVMALAAKIDVEAFSAFVETSTGLEYRATKMVETVRAWTDVRCVWAWVPSSLKGDGIFFQGPMESTPPGTVIRIRASGAFRAYVLVETSYKGGVARDGGFASLLPSTGWRKFGNEGPSWGNVNSTFRIFSRQVAEGEEAALPPTSGDVLFGVVVVNMSVRPQRLVEELRFAFKAWDAAGLGGISREDLDRLLQLMCPKLGDADRQRMLDRADPGGIGKVRYEDFIDRFLTPA